MNQKESRISQSHNQSLSLGLQFSSHPYKCIVKIRPTEGVAVSDVVLMIT